MLITSGIKKLVDKGEKMEMKSVRLNNSIRDQIVKNILFTFKRDYKESLGVDPDVDINNWANSKKRELGIGLWESKYGDVDFSHVPVELLSNTTSFRVAAQENPSSYFINISLPNGYYCSRNSVDYMFDTKAEMDIYFRPYNERKEEIERYNKKVDVLKTKVENLINSVNTTNQLAELWPDVVQYFPSHILNPQKIGLPAVRIEDIEKAMEV